MKRRLPKARVTIERLESMRLALIRLKSGLGTVEGVESELAAAGRLLDTPAP